MDKIHEIIIKNYVDRYHKVVLGEVKFSRGDDLNDDSFLIKSLLDGEEYYRGTFIKQVSTIFGDVDDNTCITRELTEQWYRKKVFEVSIEANDVFNQIRNYLMENVELRLGSRNWETVDKNGNIFLFKKVLSHFDDLEIKWMSTYIIRHIYDLWYENEVVKVSERMMGI